MSLDPLPKAVRSSPGGVPASERRFALFGAGGFGREVAWAMGAGPDSLSPVCFIDDSAVASPEAKQCIQGLLVLTLDAFRECCPEVPVAVAVGAPATRHVIVGRLDALGVSFVTLVHDRVRLSPSVSVGAGSIVCDGAKTTVDIAIGRHVHINLGCTIGHDVVVGDFATLSPGVHVSGFVHIEDRVFLGSGATVINGTPDRPLTIGAGSVIGAGACVTGDTEPDTLYVGVPAKPVRRRPER